MKLRLPLFALTCVIAFISLATTVQAKDEWINVRSKNFNLIGNANEKEIRGVAQKLEQFRETFRRLFPNMRLSTPIQTNVIVFKNDSAYTPYKPKKADGKADKWVGGYFQPGEDVNYITLSVSGDRDSTYGIIFHEYVHYVINTNFGNSTVPPWFNEGLAEFYQTFKIENDQKVYLGGLQESHLYLLQQNKFMPLKDFFNVSGSALSLNGNHSRSIFYAQAWALIHYLMVGNKEIKPGALNVFSSLVMKNVEPEKAFNQAVGMDYATMEKALKRYVEQRTFNWIIYTPTEKLVFDTEMTTLPLTEAQANAYLGDLLYHTHEYADAEVHLEKALSLDPRSSMANTSLGLVRTRQRKFDEAEKYLEKAIADDQKNHFAHYNYAYVLSRKSMDEFGYVSAFPEADLEKMQRSLKRAIEINPEFAESYRLMAFVNLVSVKNLDVSLAMQRKGLAIQPGNQSYSLLIAQILARQEKYDEAKALAQKIVATASDESMKGNAQNILQSIQQYTDAKAEFDKKIAEMTPNGSAPRLLRRENLTEEEIEKIEREREIRNLNRSIEKLKNGEKQMFGTVEKVECLNGSVRFSVQGETGPAILTSKDFQSLRMAILHEGTTNLEVGCDAAIAKETVVLAYLPSQPAVRGILGTLTGMTFVPADFRFLTDAEMNEPSTFVLGGPPTDLARNEELITAEKIDFEQKRRGSMLKQIEQNLRPPESGEVRAIGIVKKLVCSGKTVTAHVQLNGQELELRLPDDPNSLKLAIFTQDLSGMQFGCGVTIPDEPAVITYLPSPNGKVKPAGELKAVEFVPKTFRLP